MYQPEDHDKTVTQEQPNRIIPQDLGVVLMGGYTVKISTFKIRWGGGKFYHEATYVSKKEHLHEIWNEVEHMMKTGTLPGLHQGGNHKNYVILIDVPDHPHAHPHIIWDEDTMTKDLIGFLVEKIAARPVYAREFLDMN